MSGKGLLRYHPIALRLKDKKVLIAGGGIIAGRKAAQILKAEPQLYVISPRISLSLARLAKNGKIRWIKKRVSKNDILGFDMVIAATDGKLTNEKISRWARENNILVNVVDNSSLSNFISPAVLRLRKGIIAVYTDGRDPEFSRDLKNFLKESWNEFLSYRNRL